MNKYRKVLAVFVLAFVAHLGTQFLTWSLHPGNTVPGALAGSDRFCELAWDLLSFPVFKITSTEFLDASPFIAMSLNSLLVAALIGTGAWMLYSKRGVQR